MNSVLVLGDGLLGSELVKQGNFPYISRKKDGIDFTQLLSYYPYLTKYDIIINCIADTKTYSHDIKSHWAVNYEGVVNLVDACNYLGKKLVQISTDYLYSGSVENASETDVPVHCRTFYGYTKLLGDAYVQLKLKNSLIIRTSFKKNPFPYDKALAIQSGNFDYIDKVTELIIKLIYKDARGIYNVGSENARTMFEFAQETVPDILPLWDYIDNDMPVNISMNTNKMRKFLNLKENK